MSINTVGYGLTAMGAVLLNVLGTPPLVLIVGGSVLAVGGFFCGWVAQQEPDR